MGSKFKVETNKLHNGGEYFDSFVERAASEVGGEGTNHVTTPSSTQRGPDNNGAQEQIQQRFDILVEVVAY